MHVAALLVLLSITALCGAAPQPPVFRLGDAAAPVAYGARLEIDPKSERFRGEVRIQMRVTRAAPVLWLNATGLTIESVDVRQGGRKLAVRVVPGGEDFVGLEGAFEAGEAVALLRYHGRFEPVSTRGLFRQQDRAEWYVVSQFEAISARRAFPCFDEPGWKTPWQLTIDSPADNVVVSNTPEVSATSLKNGWTRHQFAQTKPLPAYLVALAVGPFDVVDGGSAGANKTPLRYLALKGRAAEARYARESTPRLLELLEDYFGSPYPFEKLDSVVIPQTVGFGAMENVGLITYASSLMLASQREETLGFRRRYAAVAAHEMAHMWFGNLVTLAWWDDIWLNEAFASWMGNKVLARFNPEWDNGWTVTWSRKSALDLDRLSSARRVHNPVDEKTEIGGAFDSITYNKGSAVLAMFENWFGPERFRAGVRSFMQRHAYGTATSNDFARALGEAAGRGEDALRVFRAFIDQPGVPLVDVALTCEASRPALQLRQQRLNPSGTAAGDGRWTTPVCVRAGAQTQCADITNGSHRMPLAGTSCPAFLMANAGGKSYYVPRYDHQLGSRLRANASQLSANEIVSLLVDAGVLAGSGLLPAEEALAWADTGLAHPSPVARISAVGLLREQRDEWLDAAQAAAKRAVLEQRVRPLAAELGWNEKPGESDETRELRAALMRYAAETEKDGKLSAQARELAKRWTQDREAVPATVTRSVLDSAARYADEPTYAALESTLLGAPELRDRSYLIDALAKVQDEKLRSRALALALRPDVSGRDAYDLIEEALADNHNRQAAFDFVRKNFDALVKKLPQDSPGELMTPLAGLCTPAERDAFVGFFKDRAGQFLGGPRRYRQALERIDICVASRGGRG